MWHLSRQNISRQLIGRKFFDPDYLTLEKNWSWSDSNTGPLPSQEFSVPFHRQGYEIRGWLDY